MALINNNYVFVADEQLMRDVESTSHPVEKGIDTTDHARRMPYELSISGKIVNHNGKKANEIVAALTTLQKNGSLITYVGRNAMSNMQIQSFETSHPNTVWGGCEFTMSLKEVRIAKPAYTAPAKSNKKKNSGTQQVKKSSNTKIYHKVKKGDTVWNLVTKTYKSLEPKYSKPMDKCKWVMSQNPKAFSRKGDFGTLQIGKKLYIGYRK